MRRMVFAAMIVSGVAEAAPVAPLPSAVASEVASGNVTLAYCGWRCRHHWRRWRRWCGWHRC
jgi:hypothetical protein